MAITLALLTSGDVKISVGSVDFRRSIHRQFTSKLGGHCTRDFNEYYICIVLLV